MPEREYRRDFYSNSLSVTTLSSRLTPMLTPQSEGCSGSSRTCGTSYALTKRLAYQQLAYNCFAVGFEQPGLFNDSFQPGQPQATLNTIGTIAQAARKFAKEQGPGIGVHLAPW